MATARARSAKGTQRGAKKRAAGGRAGPLALLAFVIALGLAVAAVITVVRDVDPTHSPLAAGVRAALSGEDAHTDPAHDERDEIDEASRRKLREILRQADGGT